MKPVTMPVHLRLARRYFSMRVIEALATMPTTMNGSTASAVIRALMLSMMLNATTPKNTYPRMSLIHRANSGISNTSPRKRLTASPGESGSAFAPGRLRMWRSRFVCSRVMVWT